MSDFFQGSLESTCSQKGENHFNISKIQSHQDNSGSTNENSEKKHYFFDSPPTRKYNKFDDITQNIAQNLEKL